MPKYICVTLLKLETPTSLLFYLSLEVIIIMQVVTEQVTTESAALLSHKT